MKHQAKVAINVGTDDKKVHMQRKIATTKEQHSHRKQQENGSTRKKQAQMMRRQRESHQSRGGRARKQVKRQTVDMQGKPPSRTSDKAPRIGENTTTNERQSHRKQQENESNGKKHAQTMRSGDQSAHERKTAIPNKRHRHRKQGQRARKRAKRQGSDETRTQFTNSLAADTQSIESQKKQTVSMSASALAPAGPILLS